MKKVLLLLLCVLCITLTGCRNAQEIEYERIYTEAYKIVKNASGLSYGDNLESENAQDEYKQIEQVLGLLRQLPSDYERGGVTAQETIDSIEKNLQSPMIGYWKCYARDKSAETVFEFRLRIEASISTNLRIEGNEMVDCIASKLSAYNTVYLNGDYFWTPDIPSHVNVDYWIDGEQLLRRDHAGAVYRYDKTNNMYEYTTAQKHIQVIK